MRFLKRFLQHSKGEQLTWHEPEGAGGPVQGHADRGVPTGELRTPNFLLSSLCNAKSCKFVHFILRTRVLCKVDRYNTYRLSIEYINRKMAKGMVYHKELL